MNKQQARDAVLSHLVAYLHASTSDELVPNWADLSERDRQRIEDAQLAVQGELTKKIKGD